MRIDPASFAPRTRIVALALALAASGCSSSLLQPAKTADEGQVRELQERVLELQRRAAVQQVELARLRERVAELEARDGSAASADRRARAASAAPPASTPASEPVDRPSDGASLRDRPDLEVTEIDDEDKPPGEAPVGRAPAVPLPAAAASGADLPPPSAAARAQYDRAYTLFHQGRYVDAESAFRRFLQEHPDNDHADNAQYWIGESRYSSDDYRGALAAFRETVERYPGGNKVPDALLKAGQCLEKLGDSEGARETYREIARRFGDSAAAVVAEERLGKLP